MNYWFKIHGFSPWMKEKLRKMRLTVFLLCITTMASVASLSYAQTTKLTVEMKNAKVVSILNEIENQSKFRFFFSNDVDVERKATINLRDVTVFDILDVLFKDTNVKYEVYERQIALIDKSADSFFNRNYVEYHNIQQQRTVTGTVTDASGQPLPGVSIIIKGTTQGTVTGADGNYSLADVSSEATLVFSFVGMRTQEIVVGSQTKIDIRMEEDVIGIEEVVAVGYGTQKKVNLTGSISTITDDQISNLPVTQASQAISGLTTGVSAIQSSGQPGNDAATITIRGLGTFSGAGNSPLVLIDGIASSLNNVETSNIKSISILKDAASAAIYGARAANGVILIETKRGRKGQVDISYNGYVGKQKAIQLPNFVDSYTYALMENEANVNDGNNIIWTDEELQKFKTGEDPDNYPNVNHYEDLVKSGSGFQTNHNLSFSAGSDKHTYYISLGYLDQEGIVDETSYEKYSFQFNIDSDFSSKFKMKASLSGNTSTQNDLASGGGQRYNSTPAIVAMAVKIPPTLAGRKSDGTYGHVTGQSIEAFMDSESFNEQKNTYFLGNIDLSYNLLKNLKVTAKGGYHFWDSKQKLFESETVLDESTTLGPSKLTVRNPYSGQVTLQAFIDYNLQLSDHSLHALGGYSWEDRYDGSNWATRDNFPNNLLYELNAGSGENMTNGGTKSEWALRSFFGRINYSFKDRYLFEVNARYDASSRFPEDTRNGFFPSFSGAWRISEEEFVSQYEWIDNLKLRATWGELGNQNIGRYPYQQVITLGLPYVIGTSKSLQPGAAVTDYPNQEITWESTRIIDLGVDLSVYKGLLGIEADYFNKKTSDILYSISISKVLGLTPSEQNAGEVLNKGFEIKLNHLNKIGDFNYSITANYSYTKNEVTELANVDQDINKGLFIGHSMNSIYTYRSDGLFVDQDDIDSYAHQPYTARPGDVRLMDISGPDGVPDGKTDPTYDREIIGNGLPQDIFGLILNADYKGFDFGLTLQGMAGLLKRPSGHSSTAFHMGSPPQQWMVDNRWSPENPDSNAKYIRMTLANKNPNSSFWYWDASFIKVKNIHLGYTLPGNIIKKAGIKNLRVYVSGSDLHVFHKFYDGWDPEMGASGRHYPTTSTYVIGINAKF